MAVGFCYPPQQISIDLPQFSRKLQYQTPSSLICVSQFVPIVRKKDSSKRKIPLLCSISDFLSAQFSSHRIGISDLKFPSSCLFVSGLFLFSFLYSALCHHASMEGDRMDGNGFFLPNTIPAVHICERCLFSRTKVHRRMGKEWAE